MRSAPSDDLQRWAELDDDAPPDAGVEEADTVKRRGEEDDDSAWLREVGVIPTPLPAIDPRREGRGVGELSRK